VGAARRRVCTHLQGAGIAAFLTLSFLGVAACGHVSLTSLMQLDRLDLASTDVARLTIAARHPDWLRVRPAGAVLMLRQEVRATGRVEIDETFLLEQVEVAEAPADLAGEARPGTVFSLLRVARADLARLRAAQALLASQGEEERVGRLGTLSVSVTGCVSGTPVAGPVLVSTYLEAAEFGRFVPLVLDVDLRREMERKDGARLEGCPRPK
jgi:hypothetical protein